MEDLISEYRDYELAQIENDPLYPLFVQDCKTYAPIIEQNKDKNFVQRIIEPDKWPYYTFPEDEREQYGSDWGSHLMSYASDNEGLQVFPQLVYDEKGKNLKLLGKKDWKEAYDYAKKTGEYITVPDKDTAEHFGSYGYKSLMGDEKTAFPMWKYGYENSLKKTSKETKKKKK